MRNFLNDNELHFYVEFVVCTIGRHRVAGGWNTDAVSVEKSVRGCLQSGSGKCGLPWCGCCDYDRMVFPDCWKFHMYASVYSGVLFRNP